MTPDAPDTSSPVPTDKPILLFDGVCNLCNEFVGLIIPRDPTGKIRFASQQSDTGKALLAHSGLPPESLETVVLIEEGRAYTKSAAVIRVGELLGWPYRLLRVGRVVPRQLRDWCYEYVAENRYSWFGKKEQCLMPPTDVSDRFLD